ncbi:MAG TPA: hypothetical protein VGP92_01695 [Acidimicrobiia bacterium]|nr:hypothetical protein [Acidimicrobiia bacterium]
MRDGGLEALQLVSGTSKGVGCATRRLRPFVVQGPLSLEKLFELAHSRKELIGIAL